MQLAFATSFCNNPFVGALALMSPEAAETAETFRIMTDRYEATSTKTSSSQNAAKNLFEPLYPAPNTQNPTKTALKDGEGDGIIGERTGVRNEGAGSNAVVSYKRPSGFRKGIRNQTWEIAKNAKGDVIDSVSGKVINPNEPWDMGHKPGFEFRKHRQSAQNRGISRKQFLDEYNNPEHYRPELPGSNRRHIGEDVTDIYFGA